MKKFHRQVIEVTDEEILAEFNFEKYYFKQRYITNWQEFILSDKRFGEFLIVEKCDDAIEVFPIVDNRMVAVSEGYWLENFYGTHFSSNNGKMTIIPTHIYSTNEVFLIKRIRGNPTMTMHFGHFLLDELSFLRCFLSLTDEKYRFIGNYDKAWQWSIISYFFPESLKDISRAHFHSAEFDSKARIGEGKGIIRRTILVKAPYRICRLENTAEPAEKIGKIAKLSMEKYREIIDNQYATQVFEQEVLLLERRQGGRFPQRWKNAKDVIEQVCGELEIKYLVVSPEEHDPIKLSSIVQKSRVVVTEPGSAAFIALMFAGKTQKVIMGHCLEIRNNNQWPSMLIDFKAFSSNLILINGKPITQKDYGDWSTQFTITNEQLLLELNKLTA